MTEQSPSVMKAEKDVAMTFRDPGRTADGVGQGGAPASTAAVEPASYTTDDLERLIPVDVRANYVARARELAATTGATTHDALISLALEQESLALAFPTGGHRAIAAFLRYAAGTSSSAPTKARQSG